MPQQGNGSLLMLANHASRSKQTAQLNVRIELIDALQLSRLMLAYGVGVEAEQTVTLHRIDNDFFEELT
jgi:restriction system protein